MITKLKNLIHRKKVSAYLYEEYQLAYEILCLIPVKSYFGKELPTNPISPPFFRASCLPASNKRVHNAVKAYMPFLLYNVFKFYGAPKDKLLLDSLHKLDVELRRLKGKGNPWVRFGVWVANSDMGLKECLSSVPQEEQVELNLSRPEYDMVLDESVSEINQWFLENWESQKKWLSQLELSTTS